LSIQVAVNPSASGQLEVAAKGAQPAGDDQDQAPDDRSEDRNAEPVVWIAQSTDAIGHVGGELAIRAEQADNRALGNLERQIIKNRPRPEPFDDPFGFDWRDCR
jgi:hypothetical protein